MAYLKNGRRLGLPPALTYITAAGHQNPVAYPRRRVNISGAHLRPKQRKQDSKHKQQQKKP